MSFERQLIRKEKFNVNRWTGGTTTQLAIYPATADYASRDFRWRLSTASIETEESRFTSLPGYHRILMVLEGQLKLEHEGHHSAILRRFEQDSFEGEWSTSSRGTAVDFNLMYASDCRGDVKAHILDPNQKLILEPSLETRGEVTLEQRCRAYYCVSGKLRIDTGRNESFEMQAGDLLLISEPASSPAASMEINNLTDGSSSLVEARIVYSEVSEADPC